MNHAHLLLGLGASLAAVLVILLGVRRLDAARPTPRVVTITTLGLGALTCAPAVAIELGLRAALGDALLIGGRFLDAFVVAALVEESLKLAVVLGYSQRRAGVLDVMDGVVYSVAASLGFGLLENAVCACADPRTALLRAVTAVPMHAVSTGVMGYFVGRAPFVRKESRIPVICAGLALAVCIHGGYDWAIFDRGPYWESLSLGVLAAGAVLFARLLVDARKLDTAMYGHAALSSIEEPWPTNITQTLVPTAPPVPQDPLQNR
ncbi:MAG: PrsW family intramembrane metalloprotease [Deltaproteobacteria bacterium]|nr:PrsW family intramembrane metalloprotease [Deltaproteobacteria bacterium]